MNSRIEFLSALNLGTPRQRGMMRALGKLRNTLVHSAKGTQFFFAAHLTDEGRRKAFSDAFQHVWTHSVPEAAFQNPRLAMWAGVMLVVVETVNEQMRLKLEAMEQAARSRIMER